MPTADALREDGCVIYPPHTLRDTDRLLEACLAPTATRSRQKSFLVSFVVDHQIVDEVHRLDFVEPLTAYLGPTAHVASVELYESDRMVGPPRVGQCYHYDNDATPQVKLFFLCSHVEFENGPLTFLSAQESADVVPHDLSGRRFSDEIVGAYTPRMLLGPPGTIGLIDPSRCLHFGSRLVTGHRRMLVVQFVA